VWQRFPAAEEGPPLQGTFPRPPSFVTEDPECPPACARPFPFSMYGTGAARATALAASASLSCRRLSAARRRDNHQISFRLFRRVAVVEGYSGIPCTDRGGVGNSDARARSDGVRESGEADGGAESFVEAGASLNASPDGRVEEHRVSILGVVSGVIKDSTSMTPLGAAASPGRPKALGGSGVTRGGVFCRGGTGGGGVTCGGVTCGGVTCGGVAGGGVACGGVAGGGVAGGDVAGGDMAGGRVGGDRVCGGDVDGGGGRVGGGRDRIVAIAASGMVPW